MTIWKYELNFDLTQVVEMPGGSEILSTAFQGDDICIWVSVDPDAPLYEYLMFVLPTGYKVTDDRIGKLIGSAMKPGLVFHVYKGNYYERIT